MDDTKQKRDERIEIRTTKEERDLFNEARKLCGDSSLSSFFVRVLKSFSLEVLEENRRILATERDREIFFDALTSDLSPNQYLQSAAEEYNRLKDEAED